MPPPPNLNLNLNLNLDSNTHEQKNVYSRDSGTKNPTHITNSAISIPSTYGRTTNAPNPGVVVGATLGAVAGFVLLLYLLYVSLTSGRRFSASTITGPSASGSTSASASEIVDVGFPPRFPGGPRPRPRRGGFVGRGRRGRGRGGGDDEQVVVEESVTDGSRGGRGGGGGGGVVEVEEEESAVDPPPSSRSRSRSRSRSSSSSGSRSDRYRRRGGVRDVDPMAYGGGSDLSGRS